MQSIKLSELAACVGGQLVVNSASTTNQVPQCCDEILISHALPLQDATAGSITLVDHSKHLTRLHASPATAVMVKEALADCRLPMLVVENLHAAFQNVIGLLRPQPLGPAVTGRHPTACVARTAKLGSDTALAAGVFVGENCVIGERCILHSGVHLMDGCVLGDDCELYPRVTLYPDTRVGQRALIHAGAVLGAYGFGYRTLAGRQVRAAQLGWVEIGDDVEIGAVTTIDRGAYGTTRIGDGTKIDNHVQIAHNCQIGKHNLICAQVGIAGSTSTGDYVVLAGQVGLADHIHLADHVTVGAQSGVMGDVEQGAVVFGSPAGPRRQRLTELSHVGRLPDMRRELKDLQAQVAALSQQLAQSTTDSCDSRQRRSA